MVGEATLISLRQWLQELLIRHHFKRDSSILFLFPLPKRRKLRKSFYVKLIGTSWLLLSCISRWDLASNFLVCISSTCWLQFEGFNEGLLVEGWFHKKASFCLLLLLFHLSRIFKQSFLVFLSETLFDFIQDPKSCFPWWFPIQPLSPMKPAILLALGLRILAA